MLPKRSPEELGEMALHAEALQQAGRLDDALAMAGEVVRGDTTRGEGFLLLARVHMERGEFADAAAAAQRARVRWLHQRSPEAEDAICEAHALVAQAAMLNDEPENAVDPLRALVASEPESSEWPLLLAECEFRSGHARAALEILRSATPSAVRDALMALALASEGEGESAMDAARSAFLREPGLQQWLSACDADEQSQSGPAGALFERMDRVFEDLPELLALFVDLAAEAGVVQENNSRALGPRQQDLLHPARLRATGLTLEEPPSAS